MNHLGLDAFLTPRTIGIVGASDDPVRFGGRVVAYLKTHFPGELVLVNRRRSTVQALPAVPSALAGGRSLDLAIIAVPADEVLAAAQDCIDADARAILVFSAGFAEAGAAGARRQSELQALCRARGVRLCGPNCIGLVNVNAGVLATFLAFQADHFRRGRVGLVSQSGAVGAVLFHEAQRAGLGVSYMLTSGNEADVTTLDWALALVEGEDVDVIGIFAEGLRNGGDLWRLGQRAAERGKDILLMKIGGTKAGARAAFSHTASLAVEDRVLDAALARAGICRVHGFHELLETAKIASARRTMAGRRVGVVTASGGMGIMVADEVERAGLAVGPLGDADRRRLEGLLPEFALAANPLDLSAQAVLDSRRMPEIWSAVMASPEFDAVCMAGVLRGLGPAFRGMMVDAAAADRLLVGWSPDAEIAAELTDKGVPVLTDARVLSQALAWRAGTPARRMRVLGAPPPSVGGPIPDGPVVPLGDGPAKALLVGAGIPLCREIAVASAEEAIAASHRLGWPVVMKATADWLTHKTEHRAVLLGLLDEAGVRDGFRKLQQILHHGDGSGTVVVQEMARGAWELVCGMQRDGTFGAVVTIGLGGVLVEIIAEQALELVPVTPALAIGMLERLCGGRLLHARRGLPPERVDDLVQILCALSTIATDHPEILEIDLNPVIVSAERVVAVDVLMGVNGPRRIAAT